MTTGNKFSRKRFLNFWTILTLAVMVAGIWLPSQSLAYVLTASGNGEDSVSAGGAPVVSSAGASAGGAASENATPAAAGKGLTIIYYDNQGVAKIISTPEDIDKQVAKGSSWNSQLKYLFNDRAELLENLRAQGASLPADTVINVYEDNQKTHPKVKHWPHCTGSVVNLTSNSVMWTREKFAGLVAHEYAHVHMHQSYGGKFPSFSYGPSGSHMMNEIIGPGAAWVEGWAEFKEYWAQGKKPVVKTLLSTRDKDGKAENTYEKSKITDIKQLLDCEGINAAILYDIAKNVPDGYAKLEKAIESGYRGNLTDFLAAFVKKNPNDAMAVAELMDSNTNDLFAKSDACRTILGEEGRKEYLTRKNMQEELINDLKVKIASFEKSRADLAQKRERAVIDLGSLREDLTTKSGRVGEIESRIKELEAKKGEITGRADELRRVEEELATFSGLGGFFKKLFSKSRHQELIIRKGELQKASSSAETDGSTLVALDDEISDLSSRLTYVKTDISVLNSKISDLESKIAEYDKSIAEKESDIKRVKDEISGAGKKQAIAQTASVRVDAGEELVTRMGLQGVEGGFSPAPGEVCKIDDRAGEKAGIAKTLGTMGDQARAAYRRYIEALSRGEGPARALELFKVYTEQIKADKLKASGSTK